MRVLVVGNSVFLDFLRFLPAGFHWDFASEPLLRGPSGEGTLGLGRRGLWRLRRRKKVERLCSRYDLVFCEWVSSWTALVSHVSPSPTVVRLHKYEIDRMDLLEAVNWWNVSRLVLVSKHYEQVAKRTVPAKTVVVANGIDTERFAFRPCNSGLVCTYGNLVGEKRVYDLMLALKDERLHIGGDGTDRRVLEEAVARFGLKHDLYGRVPIPEWLHDKEYFVLHSMNESCGVALLEAMSSGLICLCHDYAVANEILPPEYRYVTDDELRAKLREFRSETENERHNRKRALRAIVEERFDVRSQAEAFADLFATVTEEARR